MVLPRMLYTVLALVGLFPSGSSHAYTMQEVTEYFNNELTLLDMLHNYEGRWHFPFKVLVDSIEMDELEYLAHIARLQPGQMVLDFGFGMGYTSHALATRQCQGCAIIALNIAEEQVAFAEENYAHPNVTFLLYGGEPPLPFPDNAFHTVFYQETMVHVHDKGAMFKELFRVLRPGGYLAAQDWLSLVDRGSQTWHQYVKCIDMAYHTDCATFPEYHQYLRNAGFVEVQISDVKDLDAPSRRAPYNESLANHFHMPFMSYEGLPTPVPIERGDSSRHKLSLGCPCWGQAFHNNAATVVMLHALKPKMATKVEL